MSTSKFDKILKEIKQSGEPVFLIRAKDNASIDAMCKYIISIQEMECDDDFVDEVKSIYAQFLDWRKKNRKSCKNPD